ncbi:MAG: hypothetical protein QM736_15370 [Vicinamibacterales bacterium]
MRYDRRVPSFRSIAVFLLLAFVSSPALLDRCLVSCHDETPSQTAVPPCHDVGHRAQTGPDMRGVGGCGHDHASLDADRTPDSRAKAPIDHAPFVSAALTSAACVPPATGIARFETGHRLRSIRLPLDLPLRI